MNLKLRWALTVAGAVMVVGGLAMVNPWLSVSAAGVCCFLIGGFS